MTGTTATMASVDGGCRCGQDAPGLTGGVARTWFLCLLLATPAAGQLPPAEEPAVIDSLAILQDAAADTLELETVADPESSAEAPQPVPAAIPDFFDTGVSGTAAVLMSGVFPGWGQLYAENSWRAMLAFGTQWYFWSNMLSRDRQGVRYRDYARTLAPGETRRIYDAAADEYHEQVRDFAWWSGAIVLIVALDAYVGTGLYGFDEEPLPVPSRFEEFFDRAPPEPIGARGAPMLTIWQWSKRF